MIAQSLMKSSAVSQTEKVGKRGNLISFLLVLMHLFSNFPPVSLRIIMMYLITTARRWCFLLTSDALVVRAATDQYLDHQSFCLVFKVSENSEKSKLLFCTPSSPKIFTLQ